MARPKPELVLSDDERQTLTRWAARPKSTQRLALRARIVLACADEQSNKAVAVRLGVCSATVGTLASRLERCALGRAGWACYRRRGPCSSPGRSPSRSCSRASRYPRRRRPRAPRPSRPS